MPAKGSRPGRKGKQTRHTRLTSALWSFLMPSNLLTSGWKVWSFPLNMPKPWCRLSVPIVIFRYWLWEIHRCSSANISAADVYESQRFLLPLKGIIFKSVEVVLFLEHELQKLFLKEYDSFIRVKLRDVTWFSTWVKRIVRWKNKLVDHSLSLTGIEELPSPNHFLW